MKDKILEIIEHMSYRSGKNNDIEMSREGYIVRDADRLDAIGAIGIARTFQFAGHFNEPMWVGEIPDRNNHLSHILQKYYQVFLQPT